MMKFQLFTLLFVAVIFGCESKEATEKNEPRPEHTFEQTDVQPDSQIRFNITTKTIKDKRGKEIKETVRYSASVVSAIDFIKRKGQQIDPKDLSELNKESVVILEMELEKGHQNIFEAKRIQFSKDDAMKYLVGNITNDIEINQNGQSFIPEGCHFENSFSKQNRIRLYVFFKNVNRNQEYNITYHDRILDGGLMNFRINKK